MPWSEPLRSNGFVSVISAAPFQDTSRARLAFLFLGLGHEHWASLRELLAQGYNHSAIALMRLQFEAVLKAFWVSHAATEEWATRYGMVREKRGSRR